MVHLWDDQLGHSVFPYRDFDYAYKLDAGGAHTSLMGDKLSKVARWSRDSTTIFESDLPRETRVLTDLYLNNDEPAQGTRIAVLDIEVDTTDALPKVEEADRAITSIALEDRATGEEYVFILDEDRELDEYENDENSDLTVYNAHSEEELLADFLDMWEEVNPSIVTGWNTDYFDIPYLYRRIARVLGAAALRLSPVKLVDWSERRGKYVFAGISSLDYLDLYKKFTYTQQPNYRLDTIARAELNEGKYVYEGTLADLRRSNLKGYLEYNLNDVRLVSKLDDKMKLIQLVIGICSLGHVPYEDYGYSSRWLEGALITDLHRKGIVCPNKSLSARKEMDNRANSKDKGFAGAYVKAPKAGRYEWVYSLDLQSLYPSIIMSLNISPETKVGKVLNWNLEAHIKKALDEYIVLDAHGRRTVLTHLEFMEFMEESKFALSSNGILYRTDVVGIIPETLDRWFAERIEYRKKLKQAAQEGQKADEEYWDMRQHIQKIFLNSMYGVLGLPVFRFYDIDNALAVTATGQDVIKTSAKYINSKYVKRTRHANDYCIYIDTDSLYFSSLDYLGTELDSASAKQATIKLAREMEATLNKFYDGMASMLFFIDKHRFVIRGETIAQAGFWVNKKRYALKKVYDLETDQNISKIAVKGLDVVRSSFPKAFRKFMKEVLKDILDATPRAEIDQKILDFRRHLPQMPIPDVARNTAVKNISKWMVDNQALGEFVSKTPAHVKAAITHNLLLRQWNVHFQYSAITDGAKIKWVYLKENPYRAEAVAFFGDDSDAPYITKLVQQYMDYDTLFQKEFAHKLQDFYQAMNWGKIPTEVNQNASKWFAF